MIKYIVCSLLIGCQFFSQKKTFRFQLQQVKNYKFKNSYVVIDLYKEDGAQVDRPLIDKLKQRENIVFSYMSIGEAENYRSYYKKMNNKLIVKENPKWKGNYLVKFWEPEWQKLILTEYLQTIIDLGFDGVYLDVVDAFERFEDSQDKAREMGKFVIAIAEYAHKKNENFKVIIQNGFHLIRYLEDKQKFLNAIYALGVEDIFFPGDKDHDNSYSLSDWDKQGLEFYKNKPIFSIEYLKDKKLRQQYSEIAKEYKLIPLCTDRALKGEFFDCDF